MAFLLWLHAWQLAIIVYNYEYNQEVFVRLFCENQDQPELHCNGQCFLQDSIKRAEQEQESSTFEVKLNWSPICSLAVQKHNPKVTILQEHNYQSFKSSLSDTLVSRGIFHPPQS